MKFLANENFPIAGINYLKSKNFDIVSIGVDFPGVSDREVMEFAIKENRTIITFDKDYGELIFKENYKPASGVIFLRLISFTPVEPGKIVESLISKQGISFENSLTVVDENAIRQRKY
jgi:predicted nuclease of predicted toxin-antitoxin system